MAKRAAEDFEDDFTEDAKRGKIRPEPTKKHTLDSDEEDSGEEEERYNILNENDIEGEEEGISGIEGEVKFTPFNMKEEMEEGHFDREGHFQWDKTKEIKDNWLDNIDWVKVKTDKNYMERTNRGLADSSDSDDDDPSKRFNEIDTYKQILELMKPGETIKKALQRIGGNTVKLSSAERWRRKKAGIVDENAALVTKLTELTNNILTEMGNMDVYQETFEQIQTKISKTLNGSGGSSASGKAIDELDMYADDFETKEQSKLCVNLEDNGDGDEKEKTAGPSDLNKNLRWEYKWKETDEEINGPFTTEQMLNWCNDGHFKDGVVVRKAGDDTKFYSSNRIDFDLYL